MSKLKKAKPTKFKLIAKTQAQTKNVALSITDTHSQDADRHRKVKHPISEK